MSFTTCSELRKLDPGAPSSSVHHRLAGLSPSCRDTGTENERDRLFRGTAAASGGRTGSGVWTEGAKLEAREEVPTSGDPAVRGRFTREGTAEASILRLLLEATEDAGVASRATTFTAPDPCATGEAGVGVATFLVMIRVVTVVPLPTGFETLDFEKKLKLAPGADMAVTMLSEEKVVKVFNNTRRPWYAGE